MTSTKAGPRREVVATANLERPRVNYRTYLEYLAAFHVEPPAPLDWLAYKNLKNLDRWRVRWAMR